MRALFFLLVLLAGVRAEAQSALEAGVQALDAHRLDAARTHLQKARRANPRDPDVLAALARLHLDEKPPDRTAAREHVYRGLARNADHAGLLRLRLRMAYEDSGAARFETMETLRSVSRKLLRQHPHDVDALRACGESGFDDLAWRIGSTATQVDAKGIERRYDEAAGCLDTLLALRPFDADVQRERLRLALFTMHTGDARRLTGQWAAADPDRAEAWRWHGLALWFAGDESTAEAFEKAFAVASDADKARWRDPARVLAPGAEAAEAAAFWAARDPLLSTPENERWNEHLARYTLAELFFGEGPTPGVDTRRGAFLVRYGLPTDVPGALSGYGPFVSPQEGRLALWDYGDFHVVFQDWFMSGDFKYYSPPASAFAGGEPNDYTLLAEALFRRMPERMAVAGVGALEAFAVYVFPAAAGAEVYAAVAHPEGDALVAAVSERGVQRFGAAGLPGRVRVFGAAVPAGRYRLQAEAARAGRVAVAQDSLWIGEAAGLRLSTLVAADWAEEGAGPQAGTFTRGAWQVAPNVRGRFGVGVPLYVYAEASNLVPGEAMTVEVVLERQGRRRLLRPRRDASVATRFELAAEAPAMPLSYVLDTNDMAPGAYELRVVLRDAAGRHAQAHRSIVLTEPETTSER